ncbi:MAG: urease accessory UreF family protein [Limisphaerales bacterium]
MDSSRSSAIPSGVVSSASGEGLSGDVHPFTQALGSPESLASLAALADLVQTPRPETPRALESFLIRYSERLLAAVELPAIRDAFLHAQRGEVRELLRLDRRLEAIFGSSAFADASRHLGRTQLRRLRPLRSRPLQRYLEAVDSGRAHGWHVVVYGILLALFSLPLRQGLAHFALRSQEGLLESSLLGLSVPAADRARLLESCAHRVGSTVQEALRPVAWSPALA